MRGLAAGCYVDPAQAAAERERIFDRSWQFVCHASDLPAAGTAIRFDCAGRTAVVMRGRDGELHGFRNVCSHRGSRLVDGDLNTGLAFCVDARLRCPYHGWTYDETGALTSVPAGQQFTAAEIANAALQPVHVAQWRSLVFAAFAMPAVSLTPGIEGSIQDGGAAAWRGLRRLGEPRTQALGADWKLACEHLLDLSHRGIARPALMPSLSEVAPFAPYGELAVRAVGDGFEAAGSAPSWPVRAYARSLPAHASRRTELIFVWPNLLLCVMPDQLATVQVLPAATGSCTVREVSYGLPDASGELRIARYAAARVRRRARAEDKKILERVQQALATRAPDQAGPVSGSETGVQWFVDRLRLASSGEDGAPTRRRRPSKPPAIVA
jgi:carnitine monooxygenase subunit